MWLIWIVALLFATHSATHITRAQTTTKWLTAAMTPRHHTASTTTINTVRPTTNTLGQKVNRNDRTSDEYTFPRSTKSSYIEYRKEWPEGEGKSIRMRFSFRTTSSDGFLFHHTYLDALNRGRPQLTGVISRGVLGVRFSSGNISDQMTVGSGRSSYTVIL